MKRKFSTLIICLAVACAPVEKKEEFDPFTLSHLPNIQFLEKQDHPFCSSLVHNFDPKIDFQNNTYWRCRLSLAKYRIRTDNSEESLHHNSEISDLVTKISLKLADTPESILNKENSRMDQRHHNQCLKMGYVFDSEELTKIDDYFSCRRALIEEQQAIPPFGNAEYLEYPNHSYNLGFVIDRRLEIEAERFKTEKEKYPTCVKFNLNSINFKNCTLAQDRSRQCFSKIDHKRFLKEMEEKVACQKKAYINFPNEMLKDSEQRLEDIKRMKENSDFYNQSNLTSIGIDYRQFGGVKTEEEKKEKAKSKEELRAEQMKKINSKDKLYDKFELTRLRQKFIFGCQKEADLIIKQYTEELKIGCESEANFAVIGE